MQALAMVKHNGSVFWPPIVKFNGACEIKIKYFPFDDQVSVYTYSVIPLYDSTVGIVMHND